MISFIKVEYRKTKITLSSMMSV